MKKNPNKTTNSEKLNFEITAKGSLGLLAIGDIGLREWRSVKRNIANDNTK